MVSRVLSKGLTKFAQAIKKQNPSISNEQLNRELNMAFRGAPIPVQKRGGKPKPKPAGKIPPGMKKMPMSEAARRLKAARKATAEKGTKPNADGAGKAFMQNKPPAGSGDQGKQRVLPRGDKGTGKLQQQFEALTKSAQRAEVAKGANSKYASVLRKLGKLKDSKKAGGKVMKREAGGRVSDTKNATPKNKPSIPDSTKYGRGATRGADDAKMVPAKKMGGGQVMKYKKGGMVYKKHGGVVKAASGGDSLIASCYD